MTGRPGRRSSGRPTSTTTGDHGHPDPPTIDVHLTPADLRAAMEADVRAGLTRPRLKKLPPVYFYDDRGSRLFDDITRLDEYYPTRAERSILEAHAKDMIATAQGGASLVELRRRHPRQDPGTARRHAATAAARHLRPARRQRHHHLGERPLALAAEYPGPTVQAVPVGDFHNHLDRLGGTWLSAFFRLPRRDRRQLRARPAVVAFLAGLVEIMRPGDRFLLGTDVIKDRDPPLRRRLRRRRRGDRRIQPQCAPCAQRRPRCGLRAGPLHPRSPLE